MLSHTSIDKVASATSGSSGGIQSAKTVLAGQFGALSPRKHTRNCLRALACKLRPATSRMLSNSTRCVATSEVIHNVGDFMTCFVKLPEWLPEAERPANVMRLTAADEFQND